jgi:hypothetical protein
MFESNEPTEERPRWGGLSDEPGKAARQLAGLARNNPALAARLGEDLPGGPGKMPGSPGISPGNSEPPGKMPGAAGDAPGKERAPGNLPCDARQEPGKTDPAGAASRSERPSRRGGRVVPGRYHLELLASEASAGENDVPAPAPAAPPRLSGLEHFYARLLGYSSEDLEPEPEGDEVSGTVNSAPELSRAERFYARLLGHDV